MYLNTYLKKSAPSESIYHFFQLLIKKWHSKKLAFCHLHICEKNTIISSTLFSLNMHNYIHKIVFLSAAGDFYILISILNCKKDDFPIKFINLMVKYQKKLALGHLHICKKIGLRRITYL